MTSRTEYGGKTKAYKLVIDLDAADNEPNPCVVHGAHPLFVMLRVNVKSEIPHEIYSSTLGIANIGYIVDMPW